MINVLQIGMGSNPGGMENCIMNYYRKIDRTKYRFDFIDIYGMGLAYEEEIEELGGRIYCLSNYKKYPLKMKKEMEEVLRNNHFDVIHINMLSAANLLPVYVSCKVSNVKVIVHSHNSAVPSGFLRRVMNNMNIHLLRKAPVEKWACGVKAGIWMWGDGFYEENVIPNAINNKLFEKNDVVRKNIRNKCEFYERDIIIGFVGRLEEQKNPFFLLDIMKELKKIRSNYKLLVLGGGSMQDTLMEKAKKMDLSNEVYFAGVQYNTHDWYKAMDAFVLPSLFEGLPVVGIEAQASGLPCFLSDTITAEVNVSNTMQYLPINQGAKIWAEHIVNVLESKTIDKVELPEDYKIQNAIKKLERMYDELLENSYKNSCRKL